MTDRIVVMGLAGSGKSTVGAALGRALAVPFLDGDDFHDPKSRAKMRAGVPMSATDHAAWLDRLGALLAARPRVVLACAALRPSDRDRLRAAASDLVFLHLEADAGVLAGRVGQGRGGPLSGEARLRAQLDLLERPDAEPGVFGIDTAGSVDSVVADCLAALEAADPDAEAS